MKNQCSNIQKPIKYDCCNDDINSIQSIFINMCDEARLRLAHRGIFAIQTTNNMGSFFMKDINGLTIGTSIKSEFDEQLLLKLPKPNNRLSKEERRQLKAIGVYVLNKKSPD